MDRPGPRKILLLSRYDRLGGSSRVRCLQFLPELTANGFDFDLRPFFDNDYLGALYSGRKISATSIAVFYWRRVAALLRRGDFDLIWIEKEALPWIPAWIEDALLGGVPYVIDFDDAWFHRYDQQPSALLRAVLGKKIDLLMRRASIVVVGNDYLADRARKAGAARIIMLPSVIDLDRYPPASSLELVERPPGKPAVVGWIGTPITAPYLELIEPAFRAVAAEMPVRLRIVGAKAPASFAGLDTETVAWSEATEIEQILDMDIGLMPLANTVWERGKCAYKLLQVMAAGRPVIASPVGANCKVVRHGVNGLLADTAEEWAAALRSLIADRPLARRLGAAARQTVERHYSKRVALPILASTLKEAMEAGGPDRAGEDGTRR